ncbi:hypothetical protein AU255_16740 [Methyloprofundus sedimenti]|uniref:Toxin-antitoxin system antitoxin subunit n=1 Tax=Methyloprofundus sedimenti TaxID=1420851 RepID=A0A1V8M2P9_9GAMM|nr:hypothetical protein [Methyloprofundus sedimenti]OQK15837.1 hypothetical protein AU255_16740 [Methyloprofundus sedimenti]
MRQFIDHQDKRERLRFLCRVVKKEIQHLQYSAGKVFKEDFTEERASQIANDEEFAEQIEAFTSRFCRLQDTIGDKLLPAWLEMLGEKNSVTIDNLDKAERIGVLPSVEQWLELRQLRNQMIHEYIEDLAILADALQTAYQHLGFIVDVAESIITDLVSRSMIEKL